MSITLSSKTADQLEAPEFFVDWQIGEFAPPSSRPSHRELSVSLEPPINDTDSESSIDLYWLPLGAGGSFVKSNGRIFEAIQAFYEHRRPLDLYHSALVVRTPEGPFVIEQCWPVPDNDGASRGVITEGPVGSRRMARFRLFRYEIRRWLSGSILDADEAVESPQQLSYDPAQARHLLDLVSSVPALVWGRDELEVGEMWNSNSVISWLLAASGVPVENIRFPTGGRAPGWKSGLIAATKDVAKRSVPTASRSMG